MVTEDTPQDRVRRQIRTYLTNYPNSSRSSIHVHINPNARKDIVDWRAELDRMVQEGEVVKEVFPLVGTHRYKTGERYRLAEPVPA